MNPNPAAVFAELAGLMGRYALPGAPEAERSNDLGLSAMLLGIAAETWDRQADLLIEENKAVAALLGETPHPPPDFRISTLKAENDRLRQRLIEAHAAAETAGDEAGVAAIWAELAAGAERRRLSTEPV